MKQPFELNHIYTILLDIAMGMNYLHLLGVCHRDMNLGNFLIFSPFNIKVADFGEVQSDVDVNLSFTPDAGAPRFRAIEAWTTRYSPKCDVWSFGIIAGQLLGVPGSFNNSKATT